MNGTVFDIQRLSVHDGPGIRTTVFLKGCPLRCLWCHNPESQSVHPELAFYESQCIGCGECVSACPCGCHVFGEQAHMIDRQACVKCGLCVEACVGALEILGKPMSADDVLKEVKKDISFYKTSGGGITVSGGEPLMQPDFALEILNGAKALGIHTCMETSGFAPYETISRVAEAVDLLLFDYKETDPIKHKSFIGADNRLIHENLIRLDAEGHESILRCPIIPGLNDREDHFLGIAAMANKLKNVKMVHIEPYNRFGEGKSKTIGKEYALLGYETPEKNLVLEWVDFVQKHTDVPVIKS